jgi:predicted NBD/HSP70 family sugar kinase
LIAARENRQTILRLLQQQGPCSQRQLALHTRLRASTMSYIIRDLTKWGFIEQSGVIPTKRTGRKEVLLKLDGSRGWTIGLDLDREESEIVVLNAAHEILFEKTYPVRYDGGQFFKFFAKELDQIKKDLSLNDKKCLGLGISVAGAVDSEKGVVMKSISLNLEDHPIAERFREKFKIPVLVEHNAICGGFAEKLLGAAQPYDHFLLFLIRHGDLSGHFYGMAFYLNGNFYRGAHASAGELDVFLIPNPAGTHGMGFAPGSAEEDGFVWHLTRVLASLANLVDPQAIILFADDDFRAKVNLEALNEKVQQSLIQVPNRRISLHWNKLQNHALAYGAGLMQLHSGLSKMLTGLVQ